MNRLDGAHAHLGDVHVQIIVVKPVICARHLVNFRLGQYLHVMSHDHTTVTCISHD